MVDSQEQPLRAAVELVPAGAESGELFDGSRAETVSSDDGNYRFDAVLAGRWRAVAAASGCEPSMSEPFEVRAGERATIPNIRLYPTIPVTLRARSAAGRTTGAWVRIFRTDGDPEPGPPQRVHVEAGAPLRPTRPPAMACGSPSSPTTGAPSNRSSSRFPIVGIRRTATSPSRSISPDPNNPRVPRATPPPLAPLDPAPKDRRYVRDRAADVELDDVAIPKYPAEVGVVAPGTMARRAERRHLGARLLRLALARAREAAVAHEPKDLSELAVVEPHAVVAADVDHDPEIPRSCAEPSDPHI